MTGHGFARYTSTTSRGGSHSGSRGGSHVASRGGSRIDSFAGSPHTDGDPSHYGPTEQPSPTGSVSRPILRPVPWPASTHNGEHEDPVGASVPRSNTELDSDSESDSDVGFNSAGVEEEDAPSHEEERDPYFSHQGGRGAIEIKLEYGVLEPTDKIARINKKRNFYRKIQKHGFEWKLLKPKTIDNYWEEFKKYVSWKGFSSKEIKAVWARQTRERYKSHVSKIMKKHWKSKKKGMPRGLKVNAWKSFIDHWKLPNIIKRAAKNAEVRRESPAITYHGGSKSVKHHSEYLVAQGEEDNPYRVWTYTYTKNHDGETFISEKAKKINEYYMHLKAQQANPGSIQLSEEELYLKAVEKAGGNAHGRIFGQGKAATKYYGEFGSCSSQTHNVRDELRESYNQLTQVVADLSALSARREEETRQRELQFTQYISTIFGMFASSGQAANMPQQQQTFTGMLSGMPQPAMPLFNPFFPQFGTSSQMPSIPRTDMPSQQPPMPATPLDPEPATDLQAPDMPDMNGRFNF